MKASAVLLFALLTSLPKTAQKHAASDGTGQPA
jgi:hypothetical protein